MRYLCKKAYSDKFNVGDYYYDDNNLYEYNGYDIYYKYIKIDNLYFVMTPCVMEPQINLYFYTEQEIRKIKLKKLKNMYDIFV